jgi:hypothetical protein
MTDQNGNEINIMTKEEAIASVRDMEKMMEYFDGICEKCGNKRKDCKIECVEAQLNEQEAKP